MLLEDCPRMCWSIYQQRGRRAGSAQLGCRSIDGQILCILKRHTERHSRSRACAQSLCTPSSFFFAFSDLDLSLQQAKVVGRRIGDVRKETCELDSLDTPRAAVGQ